MTNYNELLNIAIEAAIEAGKSTLKYYFGEFDIHYKTDNSPLTLADLESNRIINAYLNITSIPLISEENENIPFEVRKDWQQFWLIDPLDGTKEFINRSDEFTINIALIENGKPILGVVYVPVKELLYFGSAGTGSFKIVLNGEFNLKDILTKAQVLIPDSLP
jgi:3'(2'), 5'-bisphosphate nucleotidase